ncbi:anti-sigma factor [Enterovibrio norvegicus FF-33]|uniref:Anti-sigma factor n=1 Tax=Enterovibrio norvegicus FF-454 TaxID=1185651 RepID=A0A1E5CFH3_9GAMM|nr:cupin domain-containing protein [Enterovibrio norvegicus]OEE64261.1 anti-sigma factor [Enterovibrio norvegicus FF-454]OEE66465.1 anti-sigma factor [Enterovibrio norvegicus FF-33]OEE89867.1 anti-sigma factor [Enterovibrio norvegicus FF-162]
MSDTKTASQGYIERNVDFSVPVIIKGGELPFSDTPMVGVKRMMFERRGDEIARRATSCVRYEPESFFKPHSHPGGEEYLVLDGTFSDQNGDFSKGMYVRNPVGSTHQPFTHEGCEIFVKLSQVPESEPDYFYLDTNTATWETMADGKRTLQLWQSSLESSALLDLPAGFNSDVESHSDVNEIFVISGQAIVNGEHYADHSWIRFPANTPVQIYSVDGARIYQKIGKGEVRT